MIYFVYKRLILIVFYGIKCVYIYIVNGWFFYNMIYIFNLIVFRINIYLINKVFFR